VEACLEEVEGRFSALVPSKWLWLLRLAKDVVTTEFFSKEQIKRASARVGYTLISETENNPTKSPSDT
jgi:hypothetical protein